MNTTGENSSIAKQETRDNYITIGFGFLLWFIVNLAVVATTKRSMTWIKSAHAPGDSSVVRHPAIFIGTRPCRRTYVE